jgi:hypothetical protein
MGTAIVHEYGRIIAGKYKIIVANKYQILDILGQGGNSTTYAVQDLH